ncbi:synaptonemal complex protein 3-like [Lepus europaeus]|uniref:synaptonemal complex protein 3-like n=1 Tax=Lepus europaeus TaxID=9983 RepID=UPI002B49D15B|nr:synaptonemal complex protein 3-like [Lepus europaeus]
MAVPQGDAEAQVMQCPSHQGGTVELLRGGVHSSQRESSKHLGSVSSRPRPAPSTCTVPANRRGAHPGSVAQPSEPRVRRSCEGLREGSPQVQESSGACEDMPPATVRRIKTGAKAPPEAQRMAPPDMGRPGRIKRVIYKKKQLFRRSVNASLRNIERIIVDSWKTRTEQRQAFYLRYSQQFLDALEEWDGNMQKTKQHESNMAKILELQQKVSQQAIKLRTKRLKELKTLYGNFLQSIKCLKERQIKLANEQGGFTKEMAILQAENVTRAASQVERNAEGGVEKNTGREAELVS